MLWLWHKQCWYLVELINIFPQILVLLKNFNSLATNNSRVCSYQGRSYGRPTRPPGALEKNKKIVSIFFSKCGEAMCVHARRVKQHHNELCEDERLSDPESHFRVNVFNVSLDIIIIHPLQRVVAL